jgi:hypothetical protein
MKLLALTILLLSITQLSFAQETDSTYKKKTLTTLDLETFFSVYAQEGTHSAVTGGEGDEQLSVYHVGTNINVGINASTVIFNASVDIITSPSTDKIDFIKSSASEHDNHVVGNLGYQYTLKKQRITFGAMYLFGMESDYTSNGISAWFSMVNKKKTRSFSVNTDFFFDDLRWGLLSRRKGFKPTELIYPIELRHTEWIDVYLRNSYNVNFNLRQDINKRLSVKFSFGATYQEGILSTPFHRVYFSDTTAAKVEILPNQRIRLPLSIAANWFLQRHLVFQSYYRIYWDNFGIFANTLNLQLAIKPNNKVSFYPFVRGYYQTASPYFAPYKQHLYNDTYYTSDYDFSSFGVIKAGLGFGWYPDARMGKKSKLYFNNIVIRYSFFYRTDGLSAHIISLQMGLKK